MPVQGRLVQRRNFNTIGHDACLCLQFMTHHNYYNMRKLRIKIFIIAIIIGIYAIWCRTYSFDADMATSHLTQHACNRSKHCCAWYSMRALHAGGCPAIILPAQWYRYYMPLVQFEEIPKQDYIPQEGDVVVFERPSWKNWNKISQWWGHIAMYNGKQWISDYKQKNMNPYKSDVPYRLYRYRK